MSDRGITRVETVSQEPIAIIAMAETEAATAYNRYSALQRARRDDPTLGDEECFQILITAAWNAFSAAFWRLA